MIFRTSRPPKTGGFLFNYFNGGNMKKKYLFVLTLTLMIIDKTGPLMAASTTKCTITTCSAVNKTYGSMTNCKTMNNVCVLHPEDTTPETLLVSPSCGECNAGYKLTCETLTGLSSYGSNETGGPFYCNADTGITECRCECAGCTDCDTIEWANITGRAGYQIRTVATCNCSTCTKKTEYRCAAGYYGSTSNGVSGCTKCTALGTTAANSSAGSSLQTSCYIPSRTNISDTSGVYQFTSNCYYKN